MGLSDGPVEGRRFVTRDHAFPSVALLLLACLSGCPDPVVEDPVVFDEVQASDVRWELHDEIGSLVVVRWWQDETATAYLEYSFDEGEWLASTARSTPFGEVVSLLLGVPYDTEVTFRVVNEFGQGPLATGDFTARTGPLPEGLPEPSLLTSEPDRWDPAGRWMIGSINASPGNWEPGDYWRFIVDRRGRYVWAQKAPDQHWSIFAQVSRDGRDLLWDEITFWSELDLGADGRVHRTKIDGSVVHTYATPHLQHAFVELPDGSIVWAASLGIDDRLMRVTDDGTEEQLWSCLDYLEDVEAVDYCLHNGLYYDELRDSFLVSLYSANSVVEVDRGSGDVLHAWGHLPVAWAFDPPDSAFWTQHGPSYTDAGTLLISTYRAEEDEEGVVREYELDEEAGVLRQVWSFGEGEGIQMSSNGEGYRLSNGNTLHNMGSGARVREITPEGDVVWDLAWEAPRLLGRTLLVDDLYPFAP